MYGWYFRVSKQSRTALIGAAGLFKRLISTRRSRVPILENYKKCSKLIEYFSATSSQAFIHHDELK